MSEQRNLRQKLMEKQDVILGEVETTIEDVEEIEEDKEQERKEEFEVFVRGLFDLLQQGLYFYIIRKLFLSPSLYLF